MREDVCVIYYPIINRKSKANNVKCPRMHRLLQSCLGWWAAGVCVFVQRKRERESRRKEEDEDEEGDGGRGGSVNPNVSARADVCGCVEIGRFCSLRLKSDALCVCACGNVRDNCCHQTVFLMH